MEKNSQGKKIIKEGRGNITSAEDIKTFKVTTGNPERDEDWKPWAPPFDTNQMQDSEDQEAVRSDTKTDTPVTSSQTIYVNKAKPNQVRVVNRNEKGHTVVQQGSIAFININDIAPVQKIPLNQLPLIKQTKILMLHRLQQEKSSRVVLLLIRLKK